MRLRGLRAGTVLIALVLGTGCGVFDDLSDRFKTCEETPVDIVNSQQTRAAVHIAGPEEDFSDQNRLESGASRRISLCLERGDRKRFRVMRDGVVLEATNCVASYSSYEARTVSVVWTPSGIRCEGW